jgi:hypothetical protein
MVGVSPANAGHFVLFLTTITLVICHEDTRHKSKGILDLCLRGYQLRIRNIRLYQFDQFFQRFLPA